MVTTADNNEGLISTMDPWGGGGDGGADASTSSDAINGFDDNFSDNNISMTSTTQAAAFQTESGDDASKSDAPESSSSSLPKISPINFIPRVHVDADQAPSTTLSSLSHGPLYPALPPLKDPLTQMMSSEEYISRLEAKLRRIKGGDGAGPSGKGRGRGGKSGFSSTAKQMIDALGTAKESSVLLSSDGRWISCVMHWENFVVFSRE